MHAADGTLVTPHRALSDEPSTSSSSPAAAGAAEPRSKKYT